MEISNLQGDNLSQFGRGGWRRHAQGRHYIRRAADNKRQRRGLTLLYIVVGGLRLPFHNKLVPLGSPLYVTEHSHVVAVINTGGPLLPSARS